MLRKVWPHLQGWLQPRMLTGPGKAPGAASTNSGGSGCFATEQLMQRAHNQVQLV